MPAPTLQIGDLVDSDEFGRLCVVDVIGRGGMGTVFEVERLNSTGRYDARASRTRAAPRAPTRRWQRVSSSAGAFSSPAPSRSGFSHRTRLVKGRRRFTSSRSSTEAPVVSDWRARSEGRARDPG